ncbi:MAG TPA: luciferase family protein [Pseudonocardiaceae bacterium]|jgi:hypothetical protein
MTRIWLSRRQGSPPLVSGPSPQEQITQNAPVALQERLVGLVAALPGVQVGPSYLATGGTRGFHLSPTRARGPANAFLAGTEFAHLHPCFDGSLHLVLPAEIAKDAIDAGWGVPHEAGSGLLIFGPRDEEELAVVWALLRASFHYGLSGISGDPQD